MTTLALYVRLEAKPGKFRGEPLGSTGALGLAGRIGRYRADFEKPKEALQGCVEILVDFVENGGDGRHLRLQLLFPDLAQPRRSSKVRAFVEPSQLKLSITTLSHRGGMT